MQFTELPLPGARLIDIEPFTDHRGFFARSYCQQEVKEHGLEHEVVQANLSFNNCEGTIRGLHYQIAPALECKYIRCIRGAIFDVIVDLRRDSPTYRQHTSVQLTDENRQTLFVPAMFAHGFQTLTDNTEVMYMVTAYYTPEYERGLHYADPALSIDWPIPVSQVSDKDQHWPYLVD